MRVAYDHHIFSSQFYGGISRYFYNLANTLSQSPEVDVAVIAPLYHNSYLKAATPSYVKGLPIPSVPKARRVSRCISRWLTPMSMTWFEPDIVHETYYSRQPYAPRKAGYIVTIHDMIHEKYPTLVPDAARETEAKRASIARADLIICVSENTRQDLLNLFDVPPAKTTTVYHGYDLAGIHFEGSCRVEKPPRSRSTTKEYILYVGNRWAYKNFNNLLKAYANSPWLKQNFNLLCFGGGRLSPEEQCLMATLGVTPEQVMQVSGSDGELLQAYQGAAAFVYPSLYEGFGIPVLEAMSLDCPVICSNTSSIPEVGGDAVAYFDPESPEDMAGAIERVLHSSTRRDELIQLGRQRYLQFSWKKCAQETLAVYQQML
jgi:glycosyltransferase involved in cell wall biosynthesis